MNDPDTCRECGSSDLSDWMNISAFAGNKLVGVTCVHKGMGGMFKAPPKAILIMRFCYSCGEGRLKVVDPDELKS